MKYQYQTEGTCSRLIEFEVEDGVIKDVSFLGGCHGNLQGIGALVKGMKVEDVVDKLKGIDCKGGDFLSGPVCEGSDAMHNA